MELRTGSAREAGMDPERVELARQRCQAWVKEGHTHSLSVCVARKGVVVLHDSLGRLRPEPEAPVLDERALWPISSGSKPVTAALVMQLVEEGQLGLNRPVREYLPEICAEGADAMLVHHLLTHTTGYVFHSDPPLSEHVERKIAEGFQPPPCPDTRHPVVHAVLEMFWDAPLACSPGELMIYSNHNYELLGELVRRITGRPFWEVARERVFAPLGMEDSSFVVPERDAGRVVQRPAEAPLGGFESPLMQGLGSRQMQETPYAGAGLFATARDMAVFAQTMLNGGRYGKARILSPASVAAMTRDQIPGLAAQFVHIEAPIASWGYGWTIESPAKWTYYHGSLQSLGTFSHGGGGGFKLWADPPRELVGVYLEACLKGNAETQEQFWNADLFENLITAAVED